MSGQKNAAQGHEPSAAAGGEAAAGARHFSHTRLSQQRQAVNHSSGARATLRAFAEQAGRQALHDPRRRERCKWLCAWLAGWLARGGDQ